MLWNYPPDWQTPPLERLEWKTDVLESYSGSEQRIALRQTPRRSLEFAYMITGDQLRREVEVKLWANGAKPWDVPVWTDTTYTSAAVAYGASAIPVNTQYLDFQAGGKALLQSPTGRYALVNINSIQPNQIILSSATESWPLETAVIPVRTGYLEPTQQVTRFNDNTVYDTVRFSFDDVSSHASEVSSVNYRGYPVLTMPSDWVNDLNANYQRKMQIIDFGTGGIYRDDETGQPTIIQNHFWTIEGRQQISAFRSFLYARRGRLNACWLPSFLKDLHLVASVSDSSQQITIEYCSYTALYQTQKNRRDLRIELTNGLVLYRRIIATTVVNTTSERLTLDSPLGISIDTEDIERISFMTFSRLDTDAIELSWRWSDLVSVNANWSTTNNDL